MLKLSKKKKKKSQKETWKVNKYSKLTYITNSEKLDVLMLKVLIWIVYSQIILTFNIL